MKNGHAWEVCPAAAANIIPPSVEYTGLMFGSVGMAHRVSCRSTRKGYKFSEPNGHGKGRRVSQSRSSRQ
eukprot:scaffold447567_cov15-Prasinocladus_malaysianus.AAC.1